MYTEYKSLPEYTLAVWDGDVLVTPKNVVKWSRPDGSPPPAIGTTINVSINKIGPAVVTGYFIQEGWLGLLVTLSNQQNKAGHIFGPEYD